MNVMKNRKFVFTSIYVRRPQSYCATTRSKGKFSHVPNKGLGTLINLSIFSPPLPPAAY